MKHFQLDILSPDQKIFSGVVKSIQAPGGNGLFQVLVNHAPMISTLVKGRIKIENDAGKEVYFHTEGGVIEVLNGKVIVLVERLTTPVPAEA